MYPDPGIHALLFELEERRQQAAMSRLARSCKANKVRHTPRLRWALGGALVRLGALMSGDDGLPADRPPIEALDQDADVLASS